MKKNRDNWLLLEKTCADAHMKLREKVVIPPETLEGCQVAKQVDHGWLLARPLPVDIFQE